MTKVAVVTGGNKGIGFAAVRALCKQFKGDVILTARDEGRGHDAVEALKKEGLSPKFHQLDIEDVDSINRLKKFLLKNYGGLDILINNAGIAYNETATAPFLEQTEVTLRINYTGTLNVTNTLKSILRAGARVVLVSSCFSGYTFRKCSEGKKAELLASKSTEEVTQHMQKFVEAVKRGSVEKEGWSIYPYGISKIGLCLITPMLQREFSADASRPDIIINSCCPGYVITDMTSHRGEKTIDQGADTPVYLALLPPGTNHPKGEFVSDRKTEEWIDYNPAFLRILFPL